MANRWGNNGNSERLYFLGLQNHCRWWLQPWNQKMLPPWKKSYDKPRQHIKKQRQYLADKGPSSQSYGFSSGHVWMWELDHKESWAPKNWCFWTLVLEKTLESPLDFKEIQPVHPKGSQSWIFIGRTDADTEAPIIWPPDGKSCLTGKDPDAGKKLKTGEGNDRGWDGWMASLTQWTWVWVNSGSWWWTGRPGVLQSMGSQRVGHDWAVELKWTDIYALIYDTCFSLSDFLYSVWRTLSPSKTLQMTQFPSSLWLSDISLYIHTTQPCMHSNQRMWGMWKCGGSCGFSSLGQPSHAAEENKGLRSYDCAAWTQLRAFSPKPHWSV